MLGFFGGFVVFFNVFCDVAVCFVTFLFNHMLSSFNDSYISDRKVFMTNKLLN